MDKDFSSQGSAAIAEYVVKTFQPEDERLRETRLRTIEAGLPAIQVGLMDGLHLEVIALAAGAKRAVEIGSLGGYSAIHLARALGPGGKLFCCEYSAKNAGIARESCARAGVSDRVSILVGPALETLPQLEKEGPFDLVFIDADKVNYPAYLAWAAEHLRVGGVVLGDNTFAFGMIADEKFDSKEDEASVTALRAFNREMASSGRFRSTLLPTGEGLTFGVKVR